MPATAAVGSSSRGSVEAPCDVEGTRQPLTEKEWTVLFYMSVADAGMKEELKRDLDALRQVGSNDDVNVVVHCREPSTYTPAHRFLVKKGSLEEKGSLEPYEPVPESLANLGDPQSLVTFVKWAEHFFPSRRTFLIMWGHGYGVAANLLGHERSDPTLRKRSIGKQPSNRIGVRSIYVYDWGGELTVPDLACAFGQLKKERQRKLDVLGFDACFMQGVEVAFEMRESVRYTVGSALGTPKNAWNYTRILEKIQERPNSSTETVAGMVLEGLASTGVCEDQTVLSVLNLDESKELVEAIAELVKSLKRAYDSRELQAALVLRRAAWVDGRQLPDLGDVCARLLNDSDDEWVQEKAQAALRLLEPGGFVARAKATDDRLRAQTGVSVFVPSSYAYGEAAANMNLVVNEKLYRSLDFPVKTGWADWVYSLPVVLDEIKSRDPCLWFNEE